MANSIQIPIYPTIPPPPEPIPIMKIEDMKNIILSNLPDYIKKIRK
jgi:hypothetical protein